MVFIYSGFERWFMYSLLKFCSLQREGSQYPMISMISSSSFGALLVLIVLLSQSHLHPVCYHLSCCPLEVPPDASVHKPGSIYSNCQSLPFCTDLLTHLINMLWDFNGNYTVDRTIIKPTGGIQRCQVDLHVKAFL